MQVRKFLVLAIIFLTSCNEKKIDEHTAYEYFDSINHEYRANKDIQQRLIDSLTNIIILVNNDNNAAIDITTIRTLLDSAKKSNFIHYQNIEKINEVDKKINYKSKVLDYLGTLNDFYKNELETYLSGLNNNKVNSAEAAKNVLRPKLEIIKEKQMDFQAAQQDFKEKYDRNKAASKKIAPEYEYVKYSDLNYPKATIPDGTAIELISYSGGDCSDTEMRYKQFIGVNQSNNDTVRILAICQAQRYDIDAAPRIGTFKRISLHSETVTAIENEFVIFNKNLSDIERGNYKTAFGILEFN